MDNYKLRIKIGEHEFDGEGPAEEVKEAFATWKELIASVPSQPSITKDNANNHYSDGDSDHVDPARLSRLFLNDAAKDLVSVKIFPRGNERERDTLLLILFGYKTLRGQHEVMATKLTRAMRQSGCKVSRVDRLSSRYINAGLLNKGGMGKSGRYSLTNTGVTKAVEVMNEILG
jgi:hypothetical protein